MSLINLDYKSFHLINSFAGKNQLLDLLFIFCAVYLIWIMVAIAFIWWIELGKTRPTRRWPFLGKKKWLEFGSICFSIAGAIIVNQAVSLLHFRSRPFVLLKIVNLASEPFSSKSFPSDHTAIAFAIAFFDITIATTAIPTIVNTEYAQNTPSIPKDFLKEG